MYLCIEALNEAPDIHQLTGFGGFDKGTKKYALITDVTIISDKPWSVKFTIFKSSEKNLSLHESFFDKDEPDIWNIEKDFHNPFGLKAKFYFCTKDELPKNRLQKFIKWVTQLYNK